MGSGLKGLDPMLKEDFQEIHSGDAFVNHSNHRNHQNIYINFLRLRHGQGRSRFNPIGGIWWRARMNLTNRNILAVEPRVLPQLHRIGKAHLGEATLAPELDT